MLAWLFGVILLAGGDSTDFQQSPSTETDVIHQAGSDTLVNRILSIDRVLIIGNKVTRSRIITRELSLAPGDTISSTLLQGTLQWDKNKLYNLRLFNTVSVRALELGNDHVDILVEGRAMVYFPGSDI